MIYSNILRIGNLYYDTFRNGFDGNVQGTAGIAQTVLAANGGVYPDRIWFIKSVFILYPTLLNGSQGGQMAFGLSFSPRYWL